eukprot:11340710-Alexandrium_andersonii.AAC.1
MQPVTAAEARCIVAQAHLAGARKCRFALEEIRSGFLANVSESARRKWLHETPRPLCSRAVIDRA